jgi:hypothetical protein
VGDLDRRDIAGRHDHPHADPGRIEQASGESVGHADAAVGGRISWQPPAVQRDTRPGEALHVGHPGIVIQVRVVVRVFLENAEDAGGRLAPLLTARHRRPHDPTIGVVYGDPLAAQRNDRQDRLTGGTRLNGLGRAFAQTADGARMIGPQDQESQTRNGKMRGQQSCVLVFRVRETRRHFASHSIGTA